MEDIGFTAEELEEMEEFSDEEDLSIKEDIAKELSRDDFDAIWRVLLESNDLETIRHLCRLNRTFRKNYCENERKWELAVKEKYANWTKLKTWKDTYFSLIHEKSWHGRALQIERALKDVISYRFPRAGVLLGKIHSDISEEYPDQPFGPSSKKDTHSSSLNRFYVRIEILSNSDYGDPEALFKGQLNEMVILLHEKLPRAKITYEITFVTWARRQKNIAVFRIEF